MRFIVTVIFFLLMTGIACATQPVLGFLPGTGSLGDSSYNSTTYRGMIEAKRILQAKLLVEECNNVEEAFPALEKLILGGATVVVLNGYEYKELAYIAVRRYPNVIFILNEIKWPGSKNSVSLFYDSHDVAFLAGALTGWTFPSGKVGVIAAIKVDLLEDIIDAFKEGIYYSSPDSSINVKYLASDTSGFNIPQKAFKIATEMFHKDTDIIFALAGLSGNGVIEAAKKNNRFCIGVDSDQDHMAKGHVLFSIMKNTDSAIKNAIIEAIRGTFHPGTLNIGLSQGAVGLSPMKYTREFIGQKNILRLEKLQHDLTEK